jgi:hypothetical protein
MPTRISIHAYVYWLCPLRRPRSSDILLAMYKLVPRSWFWNTILIKGKISDPRNGEEENISKLDIKKREKKMTAVTFTYFISMGRDAWDKPTQKSSRDGQSYKNLNSLVPRPLTFQLFLSLADRCSHFIFDKKNFGGWTRAFKGNMHILVNPCPPA